MGEEAYNDSGETRFLSAVRVENRSTRSGNCCPSVAVGRDDPCGEVRERLDRVSATTGH